MKTGKPSIPAEEVSRVREALKWLLENDVRFYKFTKEGKKVVNLTLLGEALGISQPATGKIVNRGGGVSDVVAERAAALMLMSKEDLRKSGIFSSPRLKPPVPQGPPPIDVIIHEVWDGSIHGIEDSSTVRIAAEHLRMQPPPTSPGAKALVKAMLDVASELRQLGKPTDAEAVLLRLCERTGSHTPRRTDPPMGIRSSRR